MKIPPFNEYLGTEIVRRGDGDVEIRLELKPHHLNRRGVAHGGVITSLLDSALGAAVIASIPKQWWCATTSLTTQFIGGAREGTLIGHGRLVRRGRGIAFATGEIRSGAGKLLATASGTWRLWPFNPGSGPPGNGPWVRLRGSAETVPVGKILAVGRNYAAHNVEMGNAETAAPVLFLKPTSALLHDGGTLQLPRGGGQVHHEVELVVVIGKPGRAIAESDALDHVLGYGVGLDMTLRDVQSEAKRGGEPWSLSKGFDGSAPISEIVPAAELGDASGLEIRLDVNGETRQRGNTSGMSRPVAALIAHASRWMTLERGDLIYTGTPAGVGPVVSGDKLEASIERIGSVRIEVTSARRGET
jgi:5-carboxymethyl-2-hydroxymuconate isomerase